MFYGFKVEVGVLPNGLAIYCTSSYPGVWKILIYFHKIQMSILELFSIRLIGDVPGLKLSTLVG